MSGIGRGLASFGQSIEQVGGEIRTQQATPQIANAEADYTNGILEAQRGAKNTGDYANAGKTFDDQAQTVLNNTAKTIADPEYRQKWIEQKRVDLARRRQSVLGDATDMQRQQSRVDLANAIEKDQNLFVDPATPEADKQAAFSRIGGTIEAAKKSGLLDPAMADKWNDTYAKGGILKEAELRVLNDPKFRQDVIKADGPRLVATDLPPEAGVLLNTIGGTESPDYNVINGGQRFSDLSDHPRVKGAGGSSTAAGRYQFVAGTWDRAKAATGVPDFSAGSQDRAAWWLAQADYKANTGRDLTSDIKAGNYSEIKKGLGSTWEGLAKLPDNEFAKRMQSGGGPAGVLRQGLYADLSPEARQALSQKAQETQNREDVKMRGALDITMQNAPVAIANTGAYDGQMPTQAQFMQAYGVDNGSQKWEMFQTAVDTSKNMYQMQTMSVADIQKMVEAAKPTSSGNDAELETKRYSALSGAAQQTIKAREADPVSYVQQAFPAVKEAWQQAAQDGDYSQAMAMTTAAQQKIGVQAPAVLPKSVAEQAIQSFKQPEISDSDRLASVSSLVFSTQDPNQRRSVFKQLVDAGLPPMMEGAMEAAARGDSGAANRLMQAALVDPGKLAKSGEVKPQEVSSAIYDSIWAPGQVGDASYGVSYGDTASIERAQRATDLMKKSVSVRIAQGQDLQSAIDGAKKDLFGDVQVYKGSSAIYSSADDVVNASLTVPANVDTAILTEGLKASKTAFKAALEGQREGLLAKVEQTGAQKAVIDTTTQNRIDDILESGVFVSVGNGVGLRDPYTGQFVVGQDGKTPMSFPIEQILGMAKKDAPGLNKPTMGDVIKDVSSDPYSQFQP
ncbi:hypothetical protein GOZ96_04710 [Agrobacterium vitis]|nr:glycoside hydrolase family 104 protein [Agrobacterium vitis]MUZ95890.1 hypothetical protein [Agrobacterium vitis]